MQFVVLYIGFVSLFASTADASNYKLRGLNGREPKRDDLSNNKMFCGTKDNYFADYRGTNATTNKGYTCLSWNEELKHEYPEAGIENNYCRNPDGDSKGAWCLTNDGTKDIVDVSLTKMKIKLWIGFSSLFSVCII